MVIDEILQTLPPSQRAMIELRIEGYEVKKIAEKTGRAKRSVERALQDFRTRLNRLIHEDV
jgi:DNA-directed RNA polymerase specialized sigma24 family protein